MKKNPYPGKFIVFEGPDGSGQSTQASLLRDFLFGIGHSVILTKEPTMDSEAGRKIREILDEKQKIEPSKLQELFVQDRKEHLDKLIIPSLKEGKAVISDRYCFSTFAFGASDDLDLVHLVGMNEQFLLPDLGIILKVAPSVCINRINKRGEHKTLFEKEKKLAKVWQTYETLPDLFQNLHIINGERSIEEIFEEIKSIVLADLNIKEEQGNGKDLKK